MQACTIVLPCPHRSPAGAPDKPQGTSLPNCFAGKLDGMFRLFKCQWLWTSGSPKDEEAGYDEQTYPNVGRLGVPFCMPLCMYMLSCI